MIFPNLPIHSIPSPEPNPKRQKVEPFDEESLFAQIISDVREKPILPLYIAEDLLLDENLLLQISSIEDFEAVEGNFFIFLLNEDIEEGDMWRYQRVLRLLYALALKNTSFLSEVLQAEKDLVRLLPLTDPLHLESKYTLIQNAGENELRVLLGEIRSLLPYLDDKRNAKILLFAEILQEDNAEELTPNFYDDFDHFISKVKEVERLIRDANVYNPRLYTKESSRSIHTPYLAMGDFLPYALPFCEALGVFLLSLKGVLGGSKEANAVWEDLFKNEDVEWMDLAMRLVSEMTKKESDSFLEALKSAQEDTQVTICLDYLNQLLTRLKITSLEGIRSFILNKT